MKPYLAASIIVTATILSGCETMSEIDKALYEVAEEAAPEDRVTGQRTLNLTDRAEQIRKGNEPIEQVIAKAKAQNAPFNEAVDAEGYARLQRIFKRVHSVSHFAHEDWELLLIPDPSFNAFVTGGTYIVVHQGLLDELQSDDEIAAVIGHEIAHVAAGHLFEREAHTSVLGLTGKKSINKEGYSESFTNLNEQEADKIGILYAALAGYDPNAAPKIWSRMASARGENWTYFKDHPAEGERAQQTHAVASKVSALYTPNQINKNHSELIKCNDLWCNKGNKPKGGEGGGLLAVLEAALDTVAKNEQTKAERSRQQVKMAEQQLAQRYGTSPSGVNSYASNSEVIVVGGRNYDVFLGCVDCDTNHPSSIFNPNGAYGSKNSNVSIWSTYGEFGNKFSNYSSCNEYASSPPLVISDNKIMGAMTLNRYHKYINQRFYTVAANKCG